MVFNVGLTNLRDIDKALNQYGYDAEQAIEDGFREFSDRFTMKLYENASKYRVPTEVIEDIDIIVDALRLSIVISGEELLYFEYGTGIVGSQNPHPKTAGWIYDINDHGDSGWIYVPTESYHYEYATEIINGRNGITLARTSGMESKPFLYDTWLWGKRSVVNIIRKHINRLR